MDQKTAEADIRAFNVAHGTQCRTFLEVADYLYNEERKQQQLRAQEQEETVERGEDDMITRCPKPNCRSGQVKYTLRQVNSSDEPMAVFLICKKCQHSWRR